MQIKHFYDQETATLTYVVFDEETKDGIIIDSVLNFDQASGQISDASIRELTSFIKDKHINPIVTLETHAHADHLSGSQVLKKYFPKIKIGIGEKIKLVQQVFKQVFNIDYLKTDASQFDLLLKDFEEISFGTLKLKAIPTPGHTPACMSYLIGNAVFTGDALFMPDYGTGRCDFPHGSAKQLYNSITKNLYSLPDSTRVFVGHDYAPGGRAIKFETTIGESKKNNIQLKQDTAELKFVEFRESRDKTLKAPKLLLPSIQINIDAGRLPPVENNGASYLKLPLKPNL